MSNIESRKIRYSEIVRCKYCGQCSSIKEWDENTYKQCTNREMKRMYLHMTDNRAFTRSGDSSYMCPKCGLWSRGWDLHVGVDKYKENNNALIIRRLK